MCVGSEFMVTASVLCVLEVVYGDCQCFMCVGSEFMVTASVLCVLEVVLW